MDKHSSSLDHHAIQFQQAGLRDEFDALAKIYADVKTMSKTFEVLNDYVAGSDTNRKRTTILDLVFDAYGIYCKEKRYQQKLSTKISSDILTEAFDPTAMFVDDLEGASNDLKQISDDLMTENTTLGLNLYYYQKFIAEKLKVILKINPGLGREFEKTIKEQVGYQAAVQFVEEYTKLIDRYTVWATHIREEFKDETVKMVLEGLWEPIVQPIVNFLRPRLHFTRKLLHWTINKAIGYIEVLFEFESEASFICAEHLVTLYNWKREASLSKPEIDKWKHQSKQWDLERIKLAPFIDHGDELNVRMGI
ncbi:MAG: hypothetical protein GOMPHAMPRED_001446 [Gomphillus americanus]|uniref:Uncharacterized protein n=1 Tax=Gomphillus americanus TaxID=1940652 RepID=A0A8H3F9Y4_9LECA|nr:MAG: hypothetical protein GOMPHAMPRED_001446 [Gomphillus americanus]